MCDTYHTLRLGPDFTKILWSHNVYGSPTNLHLGLGMGLSVSPVVLQQFIDNVFGNIVLGYNH